MVDEVYTEAEEDNEEGSGDEQGNDVQDADPSGAQEDPGLALPDFKAENTEGIRRTGENSRAKAASAPVNVIDTRNAVANVVGR